MKKKKENISLKNSLTMVGRRRKFWFLEGLKTAYTRLKIDTIIKISVQEFLNFLKNTHKKLTKK